jgi:hypothetical protein
MKPLMSQLHPALSGPFDVVALLEHAPPEDWRPEEEGEEVRGTVTSMEIETRDWGSFPVLCLVSRGRIIRVRCSAMMLKTQVVEQRIGVGSEVWIRFDGSALSKNNMTYRRFTVRSL